MPPCVRPNHGLTAADDIENADGSALVSLENIHRQATRIVKSLFESQTLIKSQGARSSQDSLSDYLRELEQGQQRMVELLDILLNLEDKFLHEME